MSIIRRFRQIPPTEPSGTVITDLAIPNHHRLYHPTQINENPKEMDPQTLFTSSGRLMKSSEGLACISLTSCRIRFTAGFFRLYFSSAIAAASAVPSPSRSPPPTIPPPIAQTRRMGRPRIETVTAEK